MAYIFLFVICGAIYLFFKCLLERRRRQGHAKAGQFEDQHVPKNILGVISHKKSKITIFGHKYKIKNFFKKFEIFHKKISTAFDFGLYFGSNCLF